MIPSLRDILRMRPFSSIHSYRGRRGMSAWRDTIDWVGGYPFEYASENTVTEYFSSRGFALIKMHSVGKGHGCNEFVFKKRA
jgi:2-polyprenyl-6-hydroxyphenyl methylase/3-demethylubiquinone-9 3-methyltransferase